MYQEEINHATRDYPFLIEHTNVKYIPHFHEETEIIYVFEGDLEVTVDSNSFTLKEGEVCIISPNRIHNLYSFNFNRVFVMKLFSVIDLCDIRLINPIVTQNSEIYNTLKKHIFNIINEDKNKPVGYSLSVNISSEKILLMILRDMENERLEYSDRIKLTSNGTFLNSINTFLEENYSDKFCLDDIAGQLNYSKSYFCHYFKKITGVTFWKYYTIFRIDKAIHMMEEYPNKKYTEISEDAGFKNIRSFNQVFKEYHHCTPKEYKKLYLTHLAM